MEDWENNHDNQGRQENNPENHDEQANDAPEVVADNEQQNVEESAAENVTASTEADDTDIDNPTDDEDDTDIDDPGVAETRFSSDGDLSWEQAERIANFSIAFMRLPKNVRERFVTIVGSGPHPVEVARAIYPGGGLIESLRAFINISSKFKDGKQPNFRDGLEFQAYISDASSSTLRAFSNIVNEFSNDDAETLTYRANMRIDNFLNATLTVLEQGISDESREVAQKISELLDIWPN